MTTAKTVTIYAKTRDQANVQVTDEDGQDILHVDGDYVPYGFGIGGGDYLELAIDVETGKVVGWDPEKFKHGVSEWLAANKEDDDE
ncbi:hypothetical protein D3C87_1770120 [compost metagenome]